jgi:hypothetical protein
MKKLLLNALIALGLVVLQQEVSMAQYPSIPDDIKKESDELMKETTRLSDIAWQKALPIIQKEAKAGKPYIPWAARPIDLPQADIPAFQVLKVVVHIHLVVVVVKYTW